MTELRFELGHPPALGQFMVQQRPLFGAGLAYLLRCALLVCPVFFLGVTGAHAEEKAGEDSREGEYLEKIKPLLAEKCYSCHGVLKQESDLRLETRELMLQGGSSGPVVVEGDPDSSQLVERITATDDSRMPPEGLGARLSELEIERLKSWIANGAVAPDEEIPSGPESHWAFRVPIKQDLPENVDTEWQANPIDAWIALGHQQHGLKPVGVASPQILLRRVYLDLIGLPPSPEDLLAFEQDPSPEAYAKVVEKLLDSPQYGERWGRHWMDVWRYSDWHGLGEQLRNSQKHIWQWRDWIVESLNHDLGYDQMVQDMLSADEIAPEDLDRLRATGFLARQYYLFNRTTWLDDAIEHTSKAFLGLTMECAKCHSHKYDPIEHVDYYRFRAIFEPYQVRLDPVPGITNLEQLALPRVFDAHLDAPTYVHLRGDEKQPDTAHLIQPGVPAILGGTQFQVNPIKLPITAYQTSLRQYVIDDQMNDAKAEIQKATLDLASAQQNFAAVQDLEMRRESIAARSAKRRASLIIDDSFDSIDDEQWEMGPGKWVIEENSLVQSANDSGRNHLRSKLSPAEDFEAILDFTTTGGNMWRSVGLAFDVADQHEVMVYASAVQSGAKVAIAYNDGAGVVYPANGGIASDVPLDTPHQLIVRVRGKLINVFFNDRLVLAYTLPIDRVTGPIEIFTFDATAKFDRVLIRGIKEDEIVWEPTDRLAARQPMTLKGASRDIELAKLKLNMVRSFPTAFTKAIKADLGKLENPGSDETLELVKDAAAAFAAYELATAQWQVSIATNDEERSKADKELQRATAAVDSPTDHYLEIRASLKSLEGPDETAESQHRPFPTTSTGRRTALAQWITAPTNPLAARVGINHIWLRHFGQPLVESVTDFGLRAAPPAQQALLDWLAVEWIEHQWSMKHIHRLMVTSRAYRSSSSTLEADSATMASDRENVFFWRGNSQRMESQVVRDSLLALADRLDPTMGGPPIPASAGTDQRRRSLYLRHSIDDHNEFVSMFDDADSLSCYRRSESVVPQQALALANSKDALEASRAIAELILKRTGPNDDQAFIHAAFRRVLSQTPNELELQICLTTLNDLRDSLSQLSAPDARRRSYENLVLALLNHNDFITIR